MKTNYKLLLNFSPSVLFPKSFDLEAKNQLMKERREKRAKKEAEAMKG